MQPSDLTIEILKSIRGEIQTTNAKLDELRASTEGRFGGVDDRLGGFELRFDRNERRMADMEIRLATEIVAVADAVREVRDLLREDRVLNARVEDHEQRLRAIESRAG